MGGGMEDKIGKYRYYVRLRGESDRIVVWVRGIGREWGVERG